MDLRQLRYFVSVAEAGSISVASRTVRVAQPALTRQIHALESELRTQLFTRVPRGVELTEAGEQFLIDAKSILDDVQLAQQKVHRTSSGQLGSLSIALPTRQHLPKEIGDILREFVNRTPGVTITLSHLLSDVQLGLLASGRLDAGFLLFRPENDQSFEGIPVFSEKTLLAYPSHWKWGQNAPSRLKDVQGVDFVWSPRSNAPAWHDALIHCFFKADFTPTPTAFGTDAGAVLTLVSAGIGCAIVSETARKIAPEGVHFCELLDLDVVHHYELVWKKENRSAALRRFIETATSALSAQKL